MDIKIRGEVKSFRNQLIARAAPVETGGDDGLANRHVRMHSDFALSGADDFPDQVADSDGHLPPAFFPGPDAARRPDVGVFVEPIASPARHGAERVADQIDRFVENGKFFAPVEEGIGHFLHDRWCAELQEARGWAGLLRQGEAERGALAGLGLYPNPAAVLLHNTLRDRQSNTSAWIFAAVQALEHAEN